MELINPAKLIPCLYSSLPLPLSTLLHFHSFSLLPTMNNKLFFALFAHFLSLTLAAPSQNSNFIQIREFKASIPFATKLNYLGGKIPDIDRAHVASIIHGTKKLNQDSAALALAEGQYSVPVINQALIYTANVSIGNPPTVYSLIIDTGSSNTWVGANKPYVPTNTTGIDEDLVLVAYGSGAFAGVEREYKHSLYLLLHS